MKRLLPLLGAFLLCLFAAPLSVFASAPDSEADRRPRPRPKPVIVVKGNKELAPHAGHDTEARRFFRAVFFGHHFHAAIVVPPTVTVVQPAPAIVQVQAPAPQVVVPPAQAADPQPAAILLEQLPAGCTQLTIAAPVGHAWYIHGVTGRRFLVRLH